MSVLPGPVGRAWAKREQAVMTDKTKDRRLGGEEYNHETDEDLK